MTATLLQLAHGNLPHAGAQERVDVRRCAQHALDALRQLFERKRLGEVREHAQLGELESLLGRRVAAHGDLHRLGRQPKGGLEDLLGRAVRQVDVADDEIRRRVE